MMMRRSLSHIANVQEIGARITPGISRITNELLTKGSGSWVYTQEGNKYLDFTVGIGVANLGHCHPHIVKAIQNQAADFVHAQIGIGFSVPMIKLIDKFIQTKPFPVSDDSAFFFASTGAEAVENAIKVARMHTGRPNIIAFQGGYHGRTLGTLSLTTSKTVYGARYGPLVPGVHIAPYPYATQLPGVKPEDFVDHCLDRLDMILKQQTTPQETAALIIEPVLGEGGYVPAPKEFLHGLRERCDKHGILFIADEVQTGFGRTGTMFAVEQSGVVPDILVCAKGLASGMPLSAIITKKKVMQGQPPGSMGGTYAGNPVSCASALATLEVFEKENILANVNARSKQLMAGLKEIQARHDYIEDVRGAGLMIGMQFEADQPGRSIGGEVAKIAKQKGLLLLTTSAFDCLRLIPPLNVTESEVSQALDILRDSFKEIKA
jgi:4-aminobutyrate aminotransferase